MEPLQNAFGVLIPEELLCLSFKKLIFYACLICQTLGMFKFGKIPLYWDRETLSSNDCLQGDILTES